MDDLEAQLRRYADHVEAQVEDVPAIGRSPRPTSSRRWPVYAAAAVVVAVVGGLVGWSIGDDEDEADVAVGDEEIELDLVVRPIDSQAPIAERRDATIALSDDHVLVWGGFDADGNLLFDGAIYDVAADAWATVSLPLQAKSTAVAVAIPEDDRAVVAQNDELALVDLATGEVTQLPDAPFPVESLLWVPGHLIATSGADIAVLDLDTTPVDAWSPVWSADSAVAGAGITDAAWVVDDTDRVLGAVRTEAAVEIVIFDPDTGDGENGGMDVEPQLSAPFAATAGGPVQFVGGSDDDRPDLTLADAAGSWHEVRFDGGYSFRRWQAPNDPRPVDGLQIVTVGDSLAILAGDRTILWDAVRGYLAPVPISLADATVVADDVGARFATFSDPSGDGIGNWLHVEPIPESVSAEVPVMVGPLLVDAGELEGRGWAIQEWGEMFEFSPDGISACTVNVYWGDAAASRNLVGDVRDVSDGTVQVLCAEEANVDGVWSRLTHVVDGPLVVDPDTPPDVAPSVPDTEVVAVPTVTSLFADTAIQTLRNAGLEVATVFEQVEIGSALIGRVIEQDPAPSELLTTGSIVTITVGEAAPEEATEEEWIPITDIAGLRVVDGYLQALADENWALAARYLSNGATTAAVLLDLGVTDETFEQGPEVIAEYCETALCGAAYEILGIERDGFATTVTVEFSSATGPVQASLALSWFAGETSMNALPPLGDVGEPLAPQMNRIFGGVLPAGDVAIARTHAVEWQRSGRTVLAGWPARNGGVGAVVGGEVILQSEPVQALDGEGWSIEVAPGSFAGATDADGEPVVFAYDFRFEQLLAFQADDPTSEPVLVIDDAGREAKAFAAQIGDELIALSIGVSEVSWIELYARDGERVTGEPTILTPADGVGRFQLATIAPDDSSVLALWAPADFEPIAAVVQVTTGGDELGRWTLPERVIGPVDFDGRFAVAPLESGRVFVIDTVADTARTADVYAEVFFD